MASSIRGTLTRPNLDTVWSMHIFFETVVETVATFKDTGKITTLMKGNPVTDLTLVVDHYFEDDEFFAEYKATAYERIPAWRKADNAAEVDSYAEENNLSTVIEEVTNPDLTDFYLVDLAPLPENITLPPL